MAIIILVLMVMEMAIILKLMVVMSGVDQFFDTFDPLLLVDSFIT